MKKIYPTVAALILFSLPSLAQKTSGSVKGVLQDSLSATPLAEATVSVVRIKDSSLISFTLTAGNGSFEIKNLEAGEYNLISSFQSLQTKKTKFTIRAEKPFVDLGTVKLERFYKPLDEVLIKDEAPVRVKGDTLAFNADAFKTKPNATVEDLLKKIPGMQVDKDGTVKAQGEEVQKVYVDGKEFFGNDPKLATKNLSADMIDQVEVFDDMSEQAKFNKIDDGSRTKAINLKLKKDKKKGVFGKAHAGYGTRNRYSAGVNASFFRGAMQTSVIAKANNTSNIGFSFTDMLGVFGGGGNMLGSGRMNRTRRGGGFGGFNPGTTGSGITSSSQMGFNYRDTWSKSLDITGSYFFNRAETRNTQTIFTQILGDTSTTLTNRMRNSLSQNNNHRVNMNLIWRIDSMNSVIYYPNWSFQKSKNNFDDTSSVFSKNLSGDYKEINQSRQWVNGAGEGRYLTNNLIWRRRFSRAGRTLSVTLSHTLNNSERQNYNVFNAKINSRNTYTSTDGKTRNYSVGFSYTEPLARNKIMEFNYNYSNNNNGSDQQAFLYNNTTGSYNIADAGQTNHFENRNEMHRIGANYRFVEKKYNYQIGFGAQQTILESNNLSKGIWQTQKFTNFFPTFGFNYQFQRSRSLRFNYRGSTRQPAISQLQDVLDDRNTPYFIRGNPLLKQEFSNNINLGYNFFNILNFRNLFAFITFNNTYNRIANSIKDTAGGGTVTVPVNLNGYYMISGNFNIGFPIRKMKGGNFNATTRISVNRDPGMFNGIKNFTGNLNMGEDLRLNYSYKEKLDVGITASVNYNSVKYSNAASRLYQDQSYFTHNYSADISYTFSKSFILSTDFDYTLNTGRTDGYNQNFALWNASFARLLFKNKRGEIKASVFDILDQNTSIARNVRDKIIEDVRNLTLQRFFSLTFTYNINRMGGKTLPGMIERGMKNRRMH